MRVRPAVRDQLTLLVDNRRGGLAFRYCLGRRGVVSRSVRRILLLLATRRAEPLPLGHGVESWIATSEVTRGLTLFAFDHLAPFAFPADAAIVGRLDLRWPSFESLDRLAGFGDPVSRGSPRSQIDDVDSSQRLNLDGLGRILRFPLAESKFPDAALSKPDAGNSTAFRGDREKVSVPAADRLDCLARGDIGNSLERGIRTAARTIAGELPLAGDLVKALLVDDDRASRPASNISSSVHEISGVLRDHRGNLLVERVAETESSVASETPSIHHPLVVHGQAVLMTGSDGDDLALAKALDQDGVVVIIERGLSRPRESPAGDAVSALPVFMRSGRIDLAVVDEEEGKGESGRGLVRRKGSVAIREFSDFSHCSRSRKLAHLHDLSALLLPWSLYSHKLADILPFALDIDTETPIRVRSASPDPTALRDEQCVMTSASRLDDTSRSFGRQLVAVVGFSLLLCKSGLRLCARKRLGDDFDGDRYGRRAR